MRKRKILQDHDSAFRLSARAVTYSKESALTILRAHIAIEQIMYSRIAGIVAVPKALQDARLTFQQLLCLTRALIPTSYDWLWGTLDLLNQCRNALAHDLEQSRFEAALDSFVRSTEPRISPDSISGPEHLQEILFILCGIVQNLGKE